MVNIWIIYLVGGLEHDLYVSIYGEQSTKLTNSYFSEGLKPPTSNVSVYIIYIIIRIQYNWLIVSGWWYVYLQHGMFICNYWDEHGWTLKYWFKCFLWLVTSSWGFINSSQSKWCEFSHVFPLEMVDFVLSTFTPGYTVISNYHGY